MNEMPDNEMTCRQVWREISNYIDGDIAPARRGDIDRHIWLCPKCKAVLDGARNMIQLVGSSEAFEPPSGFSKRLYSKLEQQVAGTKSASTQRTIPVGITEDQVPLGSHLIYFWETDEEFKRGVRFLYPGLGKGEHCILFGHNEALEKALEVLRSEGFDPEALIQKLELTVIRRKANARQTVSEIAAVIERAMRSGATAVRYLGNLGLGHNPLPAGEDDVLELEQTVDSLVAALPCVVVCMYDVRTISGRLITRGGLQTHALTACLSGVQKNPFYIPQEVPIHRHPIQ